jgi:hypothetical protein
MDVLTKGAAKRLILSLAVSIGLGGCAVYDAPPYAYDSYPYTYGTYPYTYGPYGYNYGYGYPAYAGPPVSLGLTLGYYGHSGGHYHGHHGHWGHHGHRHGGFHGAHHGSFHGGLHGR